MEQPEKNIQFPHLLKPPKGFNDEIIHHTSVKIDHFSMLQLLTDTEYTIRELSDIHKTAPTGGTLLDGITSAITATIWAAGKVGCSLVKAIGIATKDTLSGVSNVEGTLVNSIGNSRFKVITATGNAFHQVFGGISGRLLWTLILPLICYLLLLHMNGTLPLHVCCKRKTIISSSSSIEIQPISTSSLQSTTSAQALNHSESSTDSDEIFTVERLTASQILQ